MPHPQDTSLLSDLAIFPRTAVLALRSILRRGVDLFKRFTGLDGPAEAVVAFEVATTVICLASTVSYAVACRHFFETGSTALGLVSAVSLVASAPISGYFLVDYFQETMRPWPEVTATWSRRRWKCFCFPLGPIAPAVLCATSWATRSTRLTSRAPPSARDAFNLAASIAKVAESSSMSRVLRDFARGPAGRDVAASAQMLYNVTIHLDGHFIHLLHVVILTVPHTALLLFAAMRSSADPGPPLPLCSVLAPIATAAATVYIPLFAPDVRLLKNCVVLVDLFAFVYMAASAVTAASSTEDGAWLCSPLSLSPSCNTAATLVWKGRAVAAAALVVVGFVTIFLPMCFQGRRGQPFTVGDAGACAFAVFLMACILGPAVCVFDAAKLSWLAIAHTMSLDGPQQYRVTILHIAFIRGGATWAEQSRRLRHIIAAMTMAITVEQREREDPDRVNSAPDFLLAMASGMEDRLVMADAAVSNMTSADGRWCCSGLDTFPLRFACATPSSPNGSVAEVFSELREFFAKIASMEGRLVAIGLSVGCTLASLYAAGQVAFLALPVLQYVSQEGWTLAPAQHSPVQLIALAMWAASACAAVLLAPSVWPAVTYSVAAHPLRGWVTDSVASSLVSLSAIAPVLLPTPTDVSTRGVPHGVVPRLVTEFVVAPYLRPRDVDFTSLAEADAMVMRRFA